MCISFRVMSHIELTNDFVVRKDVLNLVPVPIVFHGQESNIVWCNQMARDLGFTPGVVGGQIGRRAMGFRMQRWDVAGRTYTVQFTSVINLEGEMQGSLFWPIELGWKAMGEGLHTGIGVAQDRHWIYCNEVADEVLGLSSTDHWTWDEVPWLPEWTAVISKGAQAVLVSYHEHYEIRIHGHGQWVLVETIPQPIVQQDMISANAAAALMHEVRNPLTSLMGYIELAQLEQSGPPLDRYLEQALNEATRLAHITEDILWATRDTEIQPQNVPVLPIIRQSWEELTPHADRESIELKVHCPPSTMIWVDPLRLSHILSNLLKNAKEAMMKSGNLVTVRVNPRVACTEIVVEDNGPGIDSEVMEHLFRTRRSTKPNGSGLGLMIVRRLVEAHGGKLSIESKPGHTAVRMEFPIPNQQEEG
ncbi:MAG: HAMP domain-containing histidine kinase [Firmicutes bacterium]|nr:HAMP domain-containing histidine kinase [Bacillota bacterium]